MRERALRCAHACFGHTSVILGVLLPCCCGRRLQRPGGGPTGRGHQDDQGQPHRPAHPPHSVEPQRPRPDGPAAVSHVLPGDHAHCRVLKISASRRWPWVFVCVVCVSHGRVGLPACFVIPSLSGRLFVVACSFTWRTASCRARCTSAPPTWA
jgi:hypothetical protein